MAHWRDGGIGNMAGSDDREADEFTVMERLAVLAFGSRTAAKFDVAKVAEAAFNEIEELREKVERYEAALHIIAGSTDLLQAAQAIGVLVNIGSKVTP